MFYLGIFIAVLFVPVFFLYNAFSDVPRPSEHGTGGTANAGESNIKPFANIPQIGLTLYYPVESAKLVAFGYHEANNKRALAMVPVQAALPSTTPPASVIEKVNASGSLSGGGGAKKVHFLMNTRGRGQAPTSAVDVPVIDQAEIKSPVSGRVTLVKTYMLYGKLEDNHVEIEPEGIPGVRVVMIHIKNVRVKEGDQVKAGRTVIAEPRTLTRIGSQIDRYLPKPYLHVHIQVNPYNARSSGVTAAAR